MNNEIQFFPGMNICNY